MMFVHAVFTSHVTAARAVQSLIGAKFGAGDIAALLVDRTGVRELELARTTGVSAGAMIGAACGAIGGALAVTTGLVSAGPLFLAFSGALGGSALGIVAGTLGGLGFWHDRIDFPQEAFENGAVLLGVHIGQERIAASTEALMSAGASDVRVTTKKDAYNAARESVPRSPRI